MLLYLFTWYNCQVTCYRWKPFNDFLFGKWSEFYMIKEYWFFDVYVVRTCIWGTIYTWGSWELKRSKTYEKQPSHRQWTSYTQSALESTLQPSLQLESFNFLPDWHRLDGISMDLTCNNYNNLLVMILRCLMESFNEYQELFHSVCGSQMHGFSSTFWFVMKWYPLYQALLLSWYLTSLLGLWGIEHTSH